MSLPTNASPSAFTRGMKSLTVGAIVSASGALAGFTRGMKSLTVGAIVSQRAADGAIVGAIVGAHSLGSSVAGWRGARPMPLIVLSLMLRYLLIKAPSRRHPRRDARCGRGHRWRASRSPGRRRRLAWPA